MTDAEMAKGPTQGTLFELEYLHKRLKHPYATSTSRRRSHLAIRIRHENGGSMELNFCYGPLNFAFVPVGILPVGHILLFSVMSDCNHISIAAQSLSPEAQRLISNIRRVVPK